MKKQGLTNYFIIPKSYLKHKGAMLLRQIMSQLKYSYKTFQIIQF